MKKYFIVIPVSSGVGTRDPMTMYYGSGKAQSRLSEAYIDNDLGYLKSRLNELKKKNDFYKKAFISEYCNELKGKI